MHGLLCHCTIRSPQGLVPVLKVLVPIHSLILYPTPMVIFKHMEIWYQTLGHIKKALCLNVWCVMCKIFSRNQWKTFLEIRKCAAYSLVTSHSDVQYIESLWTIRHYVMRLTIYIYTMHTVLSGVDSNIKCILYYKE